MFRIKGVKMTDNPVGAGSTQLVKSIAGGIVHASACLSLRGSKSADFLPTNFGSSEITGEILQAGKSHFVKKPRALPRRRKLTENTRSIANSENTGSIANCKEVQVPSRQGEKHSLERRGRRTPKWFPRRRRITKQSQRKKEDDRMKAAFLIAAMLLNKGPSGNRPSGNGQNQPLEYVSQGDQAYHATQVAPGSSNFSAVAVQPGTAPKSELAKGGTVPQTGSLISSPDVMATGAEGCKTSASTCPENVLITNAFFEPSGRSLTLGGCSRNLLHVPFGTFKSPKDVKFSSVESALAASIFLDMHTDEKLRNRLRKFPIYRFMINEHDKVANKEKTLEEALIAVIADDASKNSQALWVAFQNHGKLEAGKYKRAAGLYEINRKPWDKEELIYLNPECSVPNVSFAEKLHYDEVITDPDTQSLDVNFTLKNIIWVNQKTGELTVSTAKDEKTDFGFRERVFWARYVEEGPRYQPQDLETNS